MFVRRVLAACLWLGIASAASSSDPIPPSKDPWYSAPAGFEKTEPGTVLRIRPTIGNLTETVGNCSESYNILYRTTDSQYKPTWAVTTLLVPLLGPNSTASTLFNQGALLSYQVPYDSADVDASPSYRLYFKDPTQPAPYGQALGLGVFLSIPDYEGPLASFTAGVISGHATIDSVRAVINLGLGLNTTAPRVALWGYSGGALASEWASELAVQYAPDMKNVIVGAALGGLTPNVSSVLETISGTNAAGLAPSSILGITSQYPEVQEYLLSKLKTSGPYNKTTFLAAKKFTAYQSGYAFLRQHIYDYFEGGEEIFRDPKVKAIVNRDGVMGYHGVPSWPLFVYKAVQDEISKVEETDALVEKYCGVGANILYQRNSLGNHHEEGYYGIEPTVKWLVTVLTGSYAKVYNTEGCTIENVSSNSSYIPLAKRNAADVPNGIFSFW